MKAEDIGHRIYWARGGSVAHTFDDCPSLQSDLRTGKALESCEWRNLPPLKHCRMCYRLEVHGHSERIRAREAEATKAGAE